MFIIMICWDRYFLTLLREITDCRLLVCRSRTVMLYCNSYSSQGLVPCISLDWSTVAWPWCIQKTSRDFSLALQTQISVCDIMNQTLIVHFGLGLTHWYLQGHLGLGFVTTRWHRQEHQGLGCVTTHWHRQEHQGLGCVTTHWHQQEPQGLGCVTTHWHQQEHQGLGCVTTHWHQQEHQGLGCVSTHWCQQE